MKRYSAIILTGLLLLSVGCVSYKALPPCHEEDGDVAYTKDGQLRKDGLFLTWQCYQRQQQDLKACYDAAK